MTELQVLPRELDVVQRFELLKIAHETSNYEIREFALGMLRPPPAFIAAASEQSAISGGKDDA